MAEGGKETQDSMRNNLCENGEEKMMNVKHVMNIMAYPEMVQCPSLPCDLIGHALIPATCLPAIHKHIPDSSTELKRALENGPPLTPSISQESLITGGSQDITLPAYSTSSSVQLSSVFNSERTKASESSNIEHHHHFVQVQDQEAACTTSNNNSSYMRVDVSYEPYTSSEGSVPEKASADSVVGKEDPVDTNDLSATKDRRDFQAGIGAIPTVSPMFPASMMCVPVNFALTSFPSHGIMTCSFINGAGGIPAFVPYHPNMVSISSASAVSTQSGQNISCPPAMAPQLCNSQDPGPLTANFDGSASCQANAAKPHIYQTKMYAFSPPSSDDNNSNSSRSYSLKCDDNTRLVRLRKPVLDWLMKKLDTPIADNWEALADEHGMNYEDIRAHLIKCRYMQESPFLKLLETEYFHTYTIGEFIKDMDKIKRKDIIFDFKLILDNNS